MRVEAPPGRPRRAQRSGESGWRYAALSLAAGAVAVGAAIARPSDAIGSPRRVNAPSAQVGAPLVVRVAEIGVGSAAGLPTTTVRDALVGEAAAAGEVVVTSERARGSRFALRAAVTRFDREQGAFGYRVRCAVSILVEESPGGRVRMVLSGRATSEGERPRTPERARSIESAAVRGAVRSALRHVTRDSLLALR